MKKIITGTLLVLFLGCSSAFARGFIFSRNKKAPVPPPVQKVYTIDDYMKDMEYEIKANWAPPQNSFKNKTIVNFTILRDGTIQNPMIAKSSGDKEFDRTALLALSATGKVTPLPKNFLGDSIDIDFTFERFSYLVYKNRYDK